MKRKLISIMLVGAMALSLTGCKDLGSEKSNDKKLEKITMVLDWTPNTNHTGFYVAKEKGYFEDAGFDVSIVQPPEDGATSLVASGKAQYGIDFQDSLVPAFTGENPMPVTAVATLIQHNTSGIISRKGEGIDRPSGMAGKKYATWDMPIEKAMVKSVVETDGGDFSKVNMIPSNVTDEVTALKSKSVDAIWIYYAWAGIATKVKNLETDYFAFKDIKPELDYYTPVLIANNDYIKNNGDKTKAFLKAVKMGYEDAIKDVDGASKILCEAAPELDKEMVLESQKWINNEYKSEVEQWGFIDVKRWDAFYNWLYEEKLVEKPMKSGIGFTNDYLS